MCVGDLLSQGDQEPGCLAVVGAVDEHRAVLERGAVALDREIDDRVEKRVTWREQVGARCASGPHLAAFEGDPLVLHEDRRTRSDLPVPVPDLDGDMRDLEAAGFAAADPASKTREGGEEERLNVVRLEPPSLSVLEAAAQRFDVCLGENLVVQGTLGDQLV